MGFLFPKPNIPPPPPPPPAPPNPPSEAAASATAQAASQRAAMASAAGQGFNDTILTSPQGAASGAQQKAGLIGSGSTS